jgi:hypothetical protein
MSLSVPSVTLSVAQIEELSQHFSFFRHDINNSVGMIGAAAELVRYSPQAAQRWSATVIEQPARIAGKTREFVAEARRIIGLRKADEPSWYRDLWARSNAAPTEATASVSCSAETVKTLYLELIQLHKEVSLLAFAVSGVEAGLGLDASAAPDMAAGASEQTTKVARKFNQFAALFEKKFGITSVPHRLITAVPGKEVTLTPEHIAAMDGRLNQLERGIHVHLMPLLELSRLARTAPSELAARSAELAAHGPHISAVVQKFSTEFDETFGLQRTS